MQTKLKYLLNLTVARHTETEFVRGYGSENADQRLILFPFGRKGLVPRTVHTQEPAFGPCD